MFGMAYIVVTAAIAWRARSKAAYAAMPALIGTAALFWLNAPNAGAYASAIWVLAGAVLIYQGLTHDRPAINGELVAGSLYGISGIVYVAFYLGASNATLSVIPIISDSAFALGLVAGTWPSVFIDIRRGCGRIIRRNHMEIKETNMARFSVHNRGEK